MTLKFKHPLQPGQLEAVTLVDAYRAMELGWSPLREDGTFAAVQRPDGAYVVDGVTLNTIYLKPKEKLKVITIEGRIARIEIVLAEILDKLPKFITDALGESIRKNLHDMRADALDTVTDGRQFEK